jgi:hypothetical protein
MKFTSLVVLFPSQFEPQTNVHKRLKEKLTYVKCADLLHTAMQFQIQQFQKIWKEDVISLRPHATLNKHFLKCT